MVPQGSRVKMEFLIPARGLFGYKNEFLTDTKGEGVMASVFECYAPYKGDIPTRTTGSLVSFETGVPPSSTACTTPRNAVSCLSGLVSMYTKA